jgi:hypothetical protein
MTNNTKPIKTIEFRTKEDVIGILKEHGLGVHRKRKMKDYREAKRIIFKGEWIHSSIYDTQISWICEFLKI